MRETGADSGNLLIAAAQCELSRGSSGRPGSAGAGGFPALAAVAIVLLELDTTLRAEHAYRLHRGPCGCKARSDCRVLFCCDTVVSYLSLENHMDWRTAWRP